MTQLSEQLIDITPPEGGEFLTGYLDHFPPKVYQERVVIDSATGNVDLSNAIPANAIVDAADFKFATALTLATATTVSLGTSGDPDAIAESSATDAKGTRTVAFPGTALTAATTYRLTATNGSGAAAGTMVGTIDVRIVYRVLQDTLG